MYDKGQHYKPVGNDNELNVLGKWKGIGIESYLKSLNKINFSSSRNLNENIKY